MTILLLLFIGVPIIWLMIKFAKWSAPLNAIVGLAILSVGVTSGSMVALKFGGGLFVTSSVLFVLGGGLKGR